MTVTIADHLLILLLAVPVPLAGAWQYRRLRGRLAAGDAAAREKLYRGILVEEVVLSLGVVGLWIALDRPWELLSLSVPGDLAWLPWLGWAVTVLFLLVLAAQARALGADEAGLEAAREQLEAVSEMLPRTERELRLFRALSLSAGIGEELIFRGFAMVWFMAVAASLPGLGTGTALVAAMLGSSVLFGLAHLYQGPGGIAKTGAIGLLFAGLAVATGGLLAPMVAHTAVDLTSGQLAYRALRHTDDAP